MEQFFYIADFKRNIFFRHLLENIIDLKIKNVFTYCSKIYHHITNTYYRCIDQIIEEIKSDGNKKRNQSTIRL